MPSTFTYALICMVIINFCAATILEKLPCGRLLVKDAVENCGSEISFPLCEEIALRCCGGFSQCPMTEVLKCCNNGT